MTRTLTRIESYSSRRRFLVSCLVLIFTLSLGASNSVKVQVSIVSVSATQELGKPTHFIALINTGDVVINATLTPPGADPAVITWGGGDQGSSDRQRLVRTSAADVFEITVMVPGQSPVRVTIHILDATAPGHNADAPAWPVDGGSRPPNCPKGCFGQTFMEIGFDGIARPSYEVSPYFSVDRWVFQLEWVQHVYRWFVQPSGFRTDVSKVDPHFLPLISGMNRAESLNEAILDLDTRTRISPTNPTGFQMGPDRYYYWVESIAWNHEFAHVYNFYANWWQPAMELFERVDVEGSGVSVVFDCTNLATTTSRAAVASKMPEWDAHVTHRHTTAYDQHAPTAEAFAHMVTNPQYEATAAALNRYERRQKVLERVPHRRAH